MLEQRARGRTLHAAPGVHDQHLVGEAGREPEVVADHDQRHAEALLEVSQQLHDLGLGGDVERRRRLVGDQELGLCSQRDRDHHPLAHTARELVGVLTEALAGGGEADQLHQLDRAIVRRRLAHVVVQVDRLGDLRPDPEGRVERSRRVLEYHRDLAAADAPHLSLGQADQLLAFEPDRAVDLCARGQQRHDRPRADCLAAPRFADQPDRPGAGHRVAEAVHRAHHPSGLVEVDQQVRHLQQRSSGAADAGAATERLRLAPGWGGPVGTHC